MIIEDHDATFKDWKPELYQRLRALLANDGGAALREREAAAYDGGWGDGVLDALRKHGPRGSRYPEDRLLWAAQVKQAEPNPYRDTAQTDNNANPEHTPGYRGSHRPGSFLDRRDKRPPNPYRDTADKGATDA